MKLSEFFKDGERYALGYSGGVDSSYLLYAALACGADVRPYYVKTVFQPQFEFDSAMKLAEKLRTKVNVVDVDVLDMPYVADNPPDRCYYCKSAIFGTIAELACEDGCTMLIDGTNASDDAGDRPGMKALDEIGVRSPLRECGLTKKMIRELSKEAGLPTWDRPSYSCLATRVPSGTEITADILAKIEGAETGLFALGFKDFRVRYFNGAARLQFNNEEFKKATDLRVEVLSAVKKYFDIVLLDMAGRETNG